MKKESEIIKSIETLDVNGKLVVMRVDHIQNFLTQAKDTISKLRDTLVHHGAVSVVILPENVKIETLSESDLRKMGLVRIVSDFGKELESIK